MERYRPSEGIAANTENVQNWAVSQLDVVAFFLCEKERTHAQPDFLGALSYMWCRRRWGLCAAFRWSTLRTTRRQGVCRCWGHREEIGL